MPRSTRSNKCPDLEEWVFVRFLDDGKYYTCSKQRVLNEVQKPDIHYVLWIDGRKYKARILKRGTKQQVQELTKDTGHHMKSISENDYPGESKVPEIKEDPGHHMKTSGKIPENDDQSKLQVPEVKEDTGHQKLTEDTGYHMNDTTSTPENEDPGEIKVPEIKEDTGHHMKSGRIPENEDQSKLQVPEVKEDTGHQKLTEDTGYHMNDTTSTPENEEPGERHSNTTELLDAEANNYETFDDSDEDVDFIPGTSDSESSEDEANQQSLFKYKKRKTVFPALAAAGKESTNIDENSNASSRDSIIIPRQDKPTTMNPKEDFIVRACTKTETGKRKFDKFHYCIYCGKAINQLPKHFERKHKNEVAVKELLKLDKKKCKAERKQILTKLRNQGDYKHNAAVYRLGKGVIISNKSTSCPKDPSEYLTCRHCCGTFMRNHLFRHLKICKFNYDDPEQKKGRRVQSAASLLTPPVHTASAGLTFNVLNNMQIDDVSAAVRRDAIVMEFGTKIYSKVANNPNKYKNVYNKIREVGKLLLVLKENHPGNRGLSQFLAPQHYSDIVVATKKLCKWDEVTGRFGNPSLALKLGYHLLKLANIKIRNGLTGQKSDVQEAEEFLKLRRSEWCDDISCHAYRELQRRKFNSPVILPVVEDILQLQAYIKEQSELYFQRLSNDESDRVAWYELCRLTLVMLILFNRRRSGEASRILLCHYLDRSSSPLQEDVSNALSEFEKALCKKLVRFEVEGKTGKPVPVILTMTMKKNIDLLIRTREAVGVSRNNPHLFARPYFDSISPVTGSECLRKFAYACGAKHPEYITATQLRKHIATVSQVFNLTENEIELLCTHMGHDPKVHRKFYRLPEGTLQVAKLSRILIAMDRGETHLFKGKKLDEIEFDPNEVLEMEDVIKENDDSDGETLIPEFPVEDGNAEDRYSDENMKRRNDTKIRKKQSGNKNQEKGPSQEKKPKRLVKREPWLPHEKKAVYSHLASFLRERRVPGKKDCEKCKLAAEGALDRRDWKNIKFFIKNENSKNSAKH